MIRSHLFHALTRDQITAFAKSGGAVVVPLAATEQHGPHLPVYTDSMICESVVTKAVQLAAETVSLLMTPMLSIGCSEHHKNFGGTLSFTSTTYLQMLSDIGNSLVQCGFNKIIYINAHGGNEPLMQQAANDLAVKHAVWTASASYWRIASEVLHEYRMTEAGIIPGHAGAFESSMVMAIRREWVDEMSFKKDHPSVSWIGTGVPGTFVGKHGILTGHDGYTDSPIGASEEKGQVYIEAITSSLVQWLKTVLHTMKEPPDEQ
ncbi:creatininase family protein [Paenibacillus sp. LMG 31461]|uniref:Creatininase family protein n=1 Tax=Paenibacillus plantarum TaxID=2654975 RepID=A0ABX1XAG6_9BACL|nr:creatininase family protein [Paenibacillus plantarum]NOU65399.1 creatininase family protein [Paenibacillus plantarum]